MDKRFTPALISMAQVAQARTCVPASVTLAQWALESVYGAHMPAGSNNPFGIKATEEQLKSGAFVPAMTWEVVNGSTNIRVKQNFAKFNSIGEAFEKHADLLATSHYYKDAMEIWKADLVGALSHGVKAMAQHYATDPAYADKVMRIISDNKLDVYDHEIVPSKTKPSVAPVAAAPKVSTATVTEKPIMGKLMMSTGLAGSLLQAVFAGAPKVASLASHGITNSDDIKKKGADMISRLKTFDVAGALVDFNAIAADFGLTEQHVADATAAVTVTPPPSNLGSALDGVLADTRKTLGL